MDLYKRRERQRMVRRTKIDIQTDNSDSNEANHTDTTGSEPEPSGETVGEPAKPSTEEPDVVLDEFELELEAVRQEAQDNYDKYMRASAELDNVRKRTARELEDFRKFAVEKVITELLPVVDNLERAIHSSDTDEKDVDGLVEGVDLVLKDLLKVFDKFGVKPIESLEKPFDPTFHQAVMQEESTDQPNNTVISELRKGYLIHDRLLRPAMVVVSRNPG